MNSATNVHNRDFSATRTRKSSAAASVNVSDAPAKRPPRRRGDKDKSVSVSSPNNAAGYHADTDSTSGRTATPTIAAVAADAFRSGETLSTAEEDRRAVLLRRLNQINYKKNQLKRETDSTANISDGNSNNDTNPMPNIHNNITTSSRPHTDSNSNNGRRRSSSRAPHPGTTTSAVARIVKTPPAAMSRPVRKNSGLRKEDLIMIDINKNNRNPTRAPTKPLPTLVGSGLNSGTSNVKNAQVAYCLRVVKEMMRLKDAFAFSRPIDRLWQRDQLPGYFDMIKQPMDLGTVKARLEQGIYLKPIEDEAHSAAVFNKEAYASDMRLTFNNALQYNRAGDQFHEAAKRLLEKFETKFAAMPTKLSEDANKTKSKSRKRKKSGFGATGARRRDGEGARRKKQATPKSKSAAANGSSTASGSIATIGQESSSASLPRPAARKSMPKKKKDKAAKDGAKLERHGRPRVENMTALQLATRMKLIEVRLNNPKSNGSTLYNALAKALYDIELAYEEKLYIGEHVASLPGDKLARLVALASKDSNSSMEVNNNEEVELDFDGLGTKTLRDMQAIVNQTLNAKKGFTNEMPNGDVARIARNELEFEQNLLRDALKEARTKSKDGGSGSGKKTTGELYESDSSSDDSDSSSSGSDDNSSDGSSDDDSDSSDDENEKSKDDEEQRKKNRERNLAHQAAMQKAHTPLQSPGAN